MNINDLVLDYLTGLYWPRDANPASPNPKQWSPAVGFANDWYACGHSDWKLPNLLELQSLLDYSQDPAINISVFRDVQYCNLDGPCPARYWSSTTAPMDYQMPGCWPNNSAGTVDFGNGQHYLGYLAINDPFDCFQKCANYVWPVRAAQPVSPNPQLYVSKGGAGSGTVSSTPAGIDCGSACYGLYPTGEVVTLSAQSSAGSEFSGWKGCDSVAGTICTVTMNDDRMITAVFTSPSYTLTIKKAGKGSGTVTSDPAGISCGSNCSDSYQGGTVVKLTAASNSNYIFTGWSGGGCSGTGTCKVTMNAETIVNAAFSSLCGIAMTLPNGGEIWQAGLKKNLTWTSTGDSTSTSITMEQRRLRVLFDLTSMSMASWKARGRRITARGLQTRMSIWTTFPWDHSKPGRTPYPL